jgi:hypothetical protein
VQIGIRAAPPTEQRPARIDRSRAATELAKLMCSCPENAGVRADATGLRYCRTASFISIALSFRPLIKYQQLAFENDIAGNPDSVA